MSSCKYRTIAKLRICHQAKFMQRYVTIIIKYKRCFYLFIFRCYLINIKKIFNLKYYKYLKY